MSQSQSRCCSQCGTNGHNSRTCSSTADDSSSDGSGIGSGEIMLFGVRVKVDPMRKSVSMNNLSQYEQPAAHESSNNNLDASAAGSVAVDTGYASADDAVRNHSNGSRERKRGVPWTEDEHKLFLLGLHKVGKGDWRGISRNFVKTRTPTQVASHAQKYFLRRSNLNRRRRRSSLFDITTDSVAATPMEAQEAQEDNKCHQVSPLSGFPMVTTETPLETMASSNHDQVNNEFVHPITALPTPNPSKSADLDHNLNLNLDLNLSLSFDHNRSSESNSSAFQAMSSFNNGDSMISVA